MISPPLLGTRISFEIMGVPCGDEIGIKAGNASCYASYLELPV
jgi:hypothetical protein